MDNNLHDRRKKLLYRARYRGFKEADLLIGGFAEAHLDAFDDSALDAFETLLEENDRLLYDWALGKSDPPPALASPVLEQLRIYARNAGG